MMATWRAQYEELLIELANREETRGLRVFVGGYGWSDRRRLFPEHWEFPGAVHGPDYINFLRKARICIAPVHRVAFVNGVVQPGDEDSTRTYELAAGFCFFIHRRTDFAQRVYDEGTEVPMYDSAEELADRILYFLPRENERRIMAAAAHARAVPGYSFDARAAQVLAAVGELAGT
jgi:spore maturation protein CgeB